MRALTAGPSFQAAAAGAGPWGPGAECGAPAAPFLHVAAQGWEGPHYRGLCVRRDLPGQPPSGAEGRRGESCLHQDRLCQQQVLLLHRCPGLFLPHGKGWWPRMAQRALEWHQAEPEDSMLHWCSQHCRNLWTPLPLQDTRDAGTSPSIGPSVGQLLQDLAQHGTAQHSAQPGAAVPARGCCAAGLSRFHSLNPRHSLCGPGARQGGRQAFPRQSESTPHPLHPRGGTLMRLSPRKQTVSLPCRHVIISLSK